MSTDENKFDDIELDDEMLGDMELGDESENLFWNLKIPKDKTVEIEAPSIPSYIIHATKACFGPNVTKNSRSVVMCNSSEDPEEPNFIPICVLKEGVCENVNLDLVFNQSSEFKIEGNKTSEVYLTGHLQPGNTLLGDLDDLSPEDYGMDADELDLDDDEIESLKEGSSQDIDPSLQNNTEDEQEEEEEQHAQKKQKLNNKQAKVTASNGATEKKRKSPKNKPVSVEKVNENNNNNNNNQQGKKGKNKQKKQQQQAEESNGATTTEETTVTPAAAEEGKNKKKKNKKKKLPQGGEYKDLRQGTSKPIKKGDKVSVYYIGQRQSDSSIFDKTLNGSGFEFTVGKGEVIKGWDQGVIGMKGVGSKRKLWIPAKLAYGAEGYGDIAPNTNLMFTVEVKKVN